MTEKVFCGNSDLAPVGYDRVGTRYECLRKGFGAGMYSQINKRSYRSIIIILLLITIIILAGILFYLYKQHERKRNEQDRISM